MYLLFNDLTRAKDLSQEKHRPIVSVRLVSFLVKIKLSVRSNYTINKC